VAQQPEDEDRVLTGGQMQDGGGMSEHAGSTKQVF
jgi:hypothetical protein